MRRRLVLIACGIIVVSSGCGGSTLAPESGAGSQSAGSVPIAGVPVVDGGTAAQQEVVKQVMAVFPTAGIETIRLGAQPGCPDECADPTRPDDSWLYLDATADDQASSARTYFSALALVGAIRAESARVGLPMVVGKSIRVTLPDGSGEGYVDTVVDAPIDLAEAGISAEHLVAELSAAATAQGLEVSEIGIAGSDSLGLVPVAVTRVRDVEVFASAQEEVLGALRDVVVPSIGRHRAEGIYIEVRDFSDRVVRISAYSVATGEGIGWIRPDLKKLLPSSEQY